MCYYNRLVVPDAYNLTIGCLPIASEGGLLSYIPVQSGFDYGPWPIVVWSSKKNGPLQWTGHWEFLPPWLKTMNEVKASREKYNTLNAVGEHIFSSRLFAEAAQKRRCLVLSSGFYEWRHYKPAGTKKEQSYPYFIHLKNRPVFYMAGVWQPFTDHDTGELLISFAIVTQAANALMSQVHNKKNRMPVILPDEDAMAWLHPQTGRDELENILSNGCVPAEMEAYPIAKDFRQQADPVAPFAYDGLTPLS